MLTIDILYSNLLVKFIFIFIVSGIYVDLFLLRFDI